MFILLGSQVPLDLFIDVRLSAQAQPTKVARPIIKTFNELQWTLSNGRLCLLALALLPLEPEESTVQKLAHSLAPKSANLAQRF